MLLSRRHETSASSTSRLDLPATQARLSVLAKASKIAPDLLKLLGNSGSVNVVVQYSPSNPGLVGGLLGLVDDILGGLLKLISSLGGVVTQQFSSLPALTATVPVSHLLTLANNSSVAYISPDRPVASTVDLSAAASGADIAYPGRIHRSGRRHRHCRQRNLPASRSGVAHRIPPELRHVHKAGRLRPRHARGRHRGQQRRVFHRTAIHAYLPRHRARRESDRPARAWMLTACRATASSSPPSIAPSA